MKLKIKGMSYVVNKIYHISPSGNDSNDGLTEQTPFATYAKALSVLVNGDAIHFMKGTHIIPFHVSYSAQDRYCLFDGRKATNILIYGDGNGSKVIGNVARNANMVVIFEDCYNCTITGLNITVNYNGYHGSNYNGVYDMLVLDGANIFNCIIQINNNYNSICMGVGSASINITNCIIYGISNYHWNAISNNYPPNNYTFKNNIVSNGFGTYNKNFCIVRSFINSDINYFNMSPDSKNLGDPSITNLDGSLNSHIGVLGGPLGWFPDRKIGISVDSSNDNIIMKKDDTLILNNIDNLKISDLNYNFTSLKQYIDNNINYVKIKVELIQKI